MDWIFSNWPALALATFAAVDVWVSFSPSKKDDRVFGYIRAAIMSLANLSDPKRATKKKVERRG